MSEYDPGDLYEPGPRRRRRRGFPSEIEDAWAAAEADDIPDEEVEIEDLAAGYVYEDPLRPARDDSDPDEIDPSDLGPVPTYSRPLSPDARRASVSRRYSRADAYSSDPGYRAPEIPPDAGNMVPRLRAEYPPEGYEGVRRSHPTPGAMGGIPLWGILLLVLLGIVAIAAVVIALASIALALG